MKRFVGITALSILSMIVFVNGVEALPTQVISLGDDIVENVSTDYRQKRGRRRNRRRGGLAYWFETNGITNEDGSKIDPVADQEQYELFYTDTAREYEVEFLGIGYAGYHSPFGVFTYSGNPYEEFDFTQITYHDPLFVQNEVPDNSVFDFSIEADTYFGFYLDSNGKGKKLSTMVASNKDGVDHALFYNTNKGYTIAFEDIFGGGDRDYEDLVVNFNPADDSGFTAAPVPEPSTVLLMGAGLLAILGFGRKKLRNN